MGSLSIDDLPNEIIQQILFHLPISSVPLLQRVSKRFNDLTQPLLWRYHCRTQFRFWSPDHMIKEKYTNDVAKVGWKNIFTDRLSVDKTVSHTVDSILSSQLGRIEKFHRIVELGYDAKDTLLRHISVGDDAEDVLARRYYSNAILDCLHRTMAITEWAKLTEKHHVPLERALIAFDMFVLHDRDGDFDDVLACLDGVAEQIISYHPDIHEQTSRQKAITIVVYLRNNNLTGINSEDHYHDLQNNFIGIALLDKEHPSLPLISVAIFCAVATRLGLRAYPCGFPMHVHAIVKASNGRTLDGRHFIDGLEAEPMYLDPFRSDQEVLVQTLQTQLTAMGAAPRSHATYLSSTSTGAIVHRSGRNIMTSVQSAHRIAIERHGHDGHDLSTVTSTFPELDSAFYGALWASLLFGAAEPGESALAANARRRQFLPYIVEHFETHFPADVSLIEQFVIPLFLNYGEYTQLQDTVRVIRAGDSIPKQVKRRTREVSQRVLYKVGQVFQHKRYNYQAVITGWDVECGAGEHWMAQMRVDQLIRGRHQSFYHVLVEDKSVRYVAEENVEIVTPEVPRTLMALAGRHFKRWDKPTRCFVSNIKDEYPDD